MIPGYKFRIVAIVMAFIIMIYATAMLTSETLSSKRPAFPSDPSRIAAPSIGIFDHLAAAISPFGGTIEASRAMMLALQALKSDNEKTPAEQKAINERAQIAVRVALSQAPCDSQIWLALAMLQSRIDQRDPKIIESLKMSYFTAPNDVSLMPVRLVTATLVGATADADFTQVVRGDIRLILTRRPDLRIALSTAYRRGSAKGKALLEEAVSSIDPQFVPALRDEKPN